MIRPLSLCLALAVTPLANGLQAAPLTLDFLPPQMEPRDVCGTPGGVDAQSKPVGDGGPVTLEDEDRIRYLRRDIRVYSDDDADRYFDFIDALVTRQGDIDADFTPVDQTLARVDLWLRAGRLEGLEASGLIAGLRARIDEMTNNQRVILARFYADGVGVAEDRAFAQELIREAAYGGNANALLEIARLAQDGELVEGWDAPLDLTITMAFGGILGALDAGVCRRAERIAQAYVNGDVVTANPALALAWFKFAADMGRAESAWRVVEHHLNANAAQKDNIELRRYLEQAVRLGVSVTSTQEAALVASGAVNKQQLVDLLGFNHSQDAGRTVKAVAPLLQLEVNIAELKPGNESLYLAYLREISVMQQAPGRVFDRLGAEVLVSKGRWAGEAEAMVLLEEAAKRGDGRGQRRLAQMILRYRDNPAEVARAETLLMEVVARHGMPEGMDDLDTLYRCQVNDAPRLRQADVWAANYRASGHASVRINATDLLALAPDRAPETIAQIQSLALNGRSRMVASHAQRVQANPLASDAALRYWAQAVNRTKQTLEIFAELEFELAQTPAQRAQAIEFFRRVYLNNGVASALDLAVALVEYNARDPDVAKEIVTLLTMAGNRGEGGAIRLLSRLQTKVRSEVEVFAQFADTIEKRGDFLALMFAMPHIGADKVDDYMDRAVSLMNCGTKDADELGDAYALRQIGEMSYHWREVGLHFEGGHVLSKLRLSNRQVEWFDDGAAANPADAARRALGDGDGSALMRLLALTANADLETYDKEAAVGHFLNAIQRNTGAGLADVVALYRAAPEEVRTGVAESTDISAALQGAALGGDVSSAYAYGMLLRDRATSIADLTDSAKWLQEAAARGNRDAMFEYGYLLGYGLGRPADAVEALQWLEQAKSAGHPRAQEVARMVRIKGGL